MCITVNNQTVAVPDIGEVHSGFLQVGQLVEAWGWRRFPATQEEGQAASQVPPWQEGATGLLVR